MSLYTRITRNDKPLSIRWGLFHVNAMLTVSEEEHGDIRSSGKHVVRNKYVFTDKEDGEKFVILPGDVLEMWR